MTTIELSEEVMRRLNELAAAQGTDVAGVLAQAIGLQEAYVHARQRGGRLLIDDHGKISELSPGIVTAAATLSGRGTLSAG